MQERARKKQTKPNHNKKPHLCLNIGVNSICFVISANFFFFAYTPKL